MRKPRRFHRLVKIRTYSTYLTEICLFLCTELTVTRSTLPIVDIIDMYTYIQLDRGHIVALVCNATIVCSVYFTLLYSLSPATHVVSIIGKVLRTARVKQNTGE